MENLIKNFENELRIIYADSKPARREHILTATARLRAKYGQKLVSLRREDPDGADAAERAITETENRFAAQLAA